MDVDQIQAALAGLPLGGIRWYEKIGSTNDVASQWAAAGAADFALVLAGEQTAGRGRSGRVWLSPPGSSLSFSFILHPGRFQPDLLPHLTALGAMAVVRVLQNTYNLPARIKWPNDVLVYRKKVSGVLVEASWIGDHLKGAVLGIGINVASNPSMAAALDQSVLPFPPTSLQDLLDRSVDCLEILRLVLQEMIVWLPRLNTGSFLNIWEENLAFRGERVWVDQSYSDQDFNKNAQETNFQEGTLLGLFPDGSLRLLSTDGETIRITAGEVHLRPAKPPISAGLMIEN